MTRTGLWLALFGVAVSLAWLALWPVGNGDSFSAAGPFSLVVASTGFSAVLAGLIMEIAVRVEGPGRETAEAARAWRKNIGEPLPTVDPNVSAHDVDTARVLETHRFSPMKYLEYILGAAFVAAIAAMAALGWSQFSHTGSSDGFSKLMVVAGIFGVAGPAVLALVIWLTLHWRRHRVLIHPDGITVVNATSTRTFANSPNTLIVLPGKDVMAVATTISDRVTGKRAHHWMLELEGENAVTRALSEAVIVREPRQDVRRLVPLAVREPILVFALGFWFISFIGFWSGLQ